MNLIQQLQTSPKRKEFEEWYSKQSYSMNCYGESFGDEVYSHYEQGFVDLEISFQKGVFEKFIERQEAVFEQTCSADYSNKTYSIWTVETGYKKSKSFEELLIWYFNN